MEKTNCDNGEPIAPKHKAGESGQVDALLLERDGQCDCARSKFRL